MHEAAFVPLNALHRGTLPRPVIKTRDRLSLVFTQSRGIRHCTRRWRSRSLWTVCLDVIWTAAIKTSSLAIRSLATAKSSVSAGRPLRSWFGFCPGLRKVRLKAVLLKLCRQGIDLSVFLRDPLLVSVFGLGRRFRSRWRSFVFRSLGLLRLPLLVLTNVASLCRPKLLRKGVLLLLPLFGLFISLH